PLVAAALAWIFIGERPSMRTTLGGMGAFFGMSIIVSGSLGGVSLRGDLLALCMTIAMAAIMVIYRKYPSTPSAGPTAMQSVLLLPFCFVFGQPLRTDPTEIAVLGAFGLFFALAAIALAEGSKRVSSGQTALLCTLETPLAPLLALLLLAEVPANATLIGGFIVLVAAIGSIHEQKN
ncbi:MAG: DMT family transporter, partial [Pseudomonadota bacterium]